MVDVKEIKEWIKEEKFDVEIICRATHKYYLPRVAISGAVVLLFMVALVLRLVFDTADALFDEGINIILGGAFGLSFFRFSFNMRGYVSFFCWILRNIKTGNFEKQGSGKSILTVAVSISVMCLFGTAFAVLLMTLITDVKILIAIVLFFVALSFLPKLFKNPKAVKTADIICTVLCCVCISAVSEFSKDVSEYTRTYSHGGREYAIYEDDLPLKLEDLLDGVNTENYSYQLKTDKALVARKYEAVQSVRLDVGADEALPELEYTVIKVSGSLLYDLCVKNIVDNVEGYVWYEITTKEMSDNFDDAAAWGANKVYCFCNEGENDTKNRYVICYDGFIVNFETSWKYTPEQIITAGEKLKDAIR